MLVLTARFPIRVFGIEYIYIRKYGGIFQLLAKHIYNAHRTFSFLLTYLTV